MTFVLSIVLAYLLGSVNFGIVVASMRGVDIRSVGSGNPGTSNILRVLGKKDAALVLLGDGTKGALAALIGVWMVTPTWGWAALLAAVVGHAFPLWHHFSGGKSVATALGGVIALAPWVGVTLGIAWIVILVVWKTASIGSLVVMVVLVPALAVTGHAGGTLAWASLIALFVIVRHWSNIQRLVQSSERKIGP